MSTRGTFIIRRDNNDIRSLYIPSDAYPEWTGKEILEMITECVNEYNGCQVLASMLFPSGEGDFDAEMIMENIRCGKPYAYEDYSGFIKNSLFCEYAYVINLDDNTLEFYIGFQKKPDPGNRYGQKANDDGYYPCKQLCTFMLQDIAKGDNKWIIDRMIEEGERHE